jgi:hypothetical protein
MKSLFVLLSLISFPVLASESINCVSDNIHFNIHVDETETLKNVSWTIKLIDNVDVVFSGSGAFQKEVESADAFSSYDDYSAISYRDKRAVFVMGNDQSIYFPACEIQDDL